MYKTLLLLLMISLSSCSERFNRSDILGEWEVNSWTQSVTNMAIDQQMNFNFQDNGRYAVDYGAYREDGKFWIEGDILFTHEDGAVKKKVRILTLTPDEFSIEMNRSGRIEVVVLHPKVDKL